MHKHMKKAQDELEQYKNDTTKEMMLKDVLVDRLKNFTDMLKKELQFAKNIIKNPNLFQKAFQNMNFDKVEYYQLERKPKQDLALPST